MVQALINLNDHTDRVLLIVKGKYGIKNKSDAINFVIEQFEQQFIEPELRPEVVKRIKSIEKRGRWVAYNNVKSLRDDIEHA